MNRLEKQSFFVDLLSTQLEVLGYKPVGKAKFRKRSFGEASFFVVISFFGDQITHASPIFGINIPSIEKELRQITLGGDNFTISKSSMPTVFDEFYKFADKLHLQKFPFDFVIDSNSASHSVEISNCVSRFEGKLKDFGELCRIVQDSTAGFPIGHHAFRLPLIIRKFGNEENVKDYVNFVKSLNFIQDYDSFLKEAQLQ